MTSERLWDASITTVDLRTIVCPRQEEFEFFESLGGVRPCEAGGFEPGPDHYER